LNRLLARLVPLVPLASLASFASLASLAGACVSNSVGEPSGGEDSGVLTPLGDAGGVDATLPGADAGTDSGPLPPPVDAGQPDVTGIDANVPDTSSPIDAAFQDATSDAGRDAGSDAAVDSGAAPDDAGVADANRPDAALEQACGDWSAFYCQQLSACSVNAFEISSVWGSIGACTNGLDALCLSSLTAPGVTQTAAATEACAIALKMGDVACGQFVSGPPSGACAVSPGTFATAAACAFDMQCASSFCAIPLGSACGTCQPPTTVGGACTAGVCSAGQACDPKTALCVAIESVGTGDPCDISPQCDLVNGTACDPASKTCSLHVRTEFPLDAGCGQADGSTTEVTCPGNATCSTSAFPGACQPAANVGSPCTTDGGVNCVAPSMCAAGVCTLPSAAMCP
jgi:hypothetical protein